MKHTIQLHGLLAEKYDKDPITLYADGLLDIFDGLVSRFGVGFKYEVYNNNWALYQGELDEDRPVTEEYLAAPLEETLHIVAKPEGELGLIGALLTAIGTAGGAVAGAGAALTTFAGTAAGTIISAALTIGAGLAVSAIAQALAPKMDYNSDPEKKLSFLYNGVVNNAEQGGAVPLIYGKAMAGSTIVSVNISSDEIGERDQVLTTANSNLDDLGNFQWVGNGATVNLDTGFRLITLEKTSAAGSFGGATLQTALDPNTDYIITVNARSPYVTNIAGGAFTTENGIPIDKTIYRAYNVDLLDGATTIASGRKEPIIMDFFAVTGSNVDTTLVIHFNSGTNVVSPDIRVYLDATEPVGTSMQIRRVTLEKANV